MEQRSKNFRVMIVDDEAILRTGLLHLCHWSDHGIDIVAQASNGQEALQLIEAARPHVVITDIVMPLMDGVEFTKAMKSRYPGIKLIVLSSYSEFSYVREVFKYGVTDYLLKPKVSAPELISLIQGLCSELEWKDKAPAAETQDIALALGQWLDHDLPQEEMDEELRGQLSRHFPSRFYRLALADIGLLLNRTKWTQSQVEQVILQNAADQLSGLAYTVVFLKNEVLLLINYDVQDAGEALASFAGFTRHVKASLNFVSFLQSEAFEDIRQTAKERERLLPRLGKLIYFPDTTLVSETRVIEHNDDSASFDQTAFLTALRMLALDEAIRQLKALLAGISSAQSYNEYSLKLLCQNLVYNALTSLEQMNQPVMELGASKLKLFKRIDLAFDIRELEEVLLQFLQALKGVIRSADPSQTAILQKIYDYVNENFEKDISLAEMANALHLNYSYLSSYFKQRTGENLTSYINRVRTGKAKELLFNHELSISEVSRLTGFSEHNYFSKVFKKMTGMTPAEYRNHIFQ
ncbi:response regulator transcription factor [Paenibacillus sanfengchensis]|uniref:response regulator transcription factor n=1 Tax=Paenibacillus sanfengchensis TaxID=3119819 RepID=UPI002FE339D2